MAISVNGTRWYVFAPILRFYSHMPRVYWILIQFDIQTSLQNPCSKNPCENEGACIPLYHLDDFKCQCPSGLGGKKCEIIAGRCGSQNMSVRKYYVNAKRISEQRTNIFPFTLVTWGRGGEGLSGTRTRDNSTVVDVSSVLSPMAN